MDFIAFTENVTRHFRVPESGLVAKVHASLKHLAHRYVSH
jgi:hypothetical protein